MPRRPFSTSIALVWAMALFVAASQLGVNAAAQKAKPKNAPAATVKNSPVELRDIEPLKAALNRDRGKVRLVTILSPT